MNVSWLGVNGVLYDVDTDLLRVTYDEHFGECLEIQRDTQRLIVPLCEIRDDIVIKES
jgi:hypothetical protein